MVKQFHWLDMEKKIISYIRFFSNCLHGIAESNYKRNKMNKFQKKMLSKCLSTKGYVSGFGNPGFAIWPLTDPSKSWTFLIFGK